MTNATISTDPVTRYAHATYPVPADAGDCVTVECAWSPNGEAWAPAAVLPHVSDSARRFIAPSEWDAATQHGVIQEHFAAGTSRTLVLNPFASAMPPSGSAMVRIRVKSEDLVLAESVTHLALDNANVILANDWSRIIQRDALAAGGDAWEMADREGQSVLHCPRKGLALPQLTYPLDLSGAYALFVALPPGLGAIELRLSGDDRCQYFENHMPGQECFWRWADMTRQHLVIRQPHRTIGMHEDEFLAHLAYVRLVPLTDDEVDELEQLWRADGPRKQVFGYNEPYSWAFHEDVQHNLQHREPLLAFREGRVDVVDVNIGRVGMKSVFESRVGDQLVYSTHGDAVRGKTPITDNVGRMQQYTNTLAAQLRHARDLGLQAYANLGATRCYAGSDLEAEISANHPEWRIDDRMDYEVPEVRAHALALLEEALQIGAKGISIGWCRYPHSLRHPDTATGFLRELRALTQRYENVPVLVHFPAHGVYQAEHMDYRRWIDEALVDVLCPATITQLGYGFPLDDYVAAAAGSGILVCPGLNASAIDWPGGWYERLDSYYRAGADGVYVYQCDKPAVRNAAARRCLSLFGSPQALQRWRRREANEQQRYSRNVYVLPPPNSRGVYGTACPLQLWVEGMTAKRVDLAWDSGQTRSFSRPPYFYEFQPAAEGGVQPGARLLEVVVEAEEGTFSRRFEIAID